MKIGFTCSDSPLSRIIRRVTKEPVSHVIIMAEGYVIHSNFYGVHAEPIETYKPEIVYSVEVDTSYQRLLGCFLRRRKAWYDFGALLYLALRSILPWLPKKNLWQCSGMDLCTEWVTEVIDGQSDPMITPYQLYLRLKEETHEHLESSGY